MSMPRAWMHSSMMALLSWAAHSTTLRRFCWSSTPKAGKPSRPDSPTTPGYQWGYGALQTGSAGKSSWTADGNEQPHGTRHGISLTLVLQKLRPAQALGTAQAAT